MEGKDFDTAKQVDKIDVYDGEVFSVGDDKTTSFIFEDGYVYYSVKIDPKGFGIQYIFDNK